MSRGAFMGGTGKRGNAEHNDALRGISPRVGHAIDRIDRVVINLVLPQAGVERLVERGGNPLAIAGTGRGRTQLADHADLEHAMGRNPRQFDFPGPRFHPHILNIGQVNQRTDRDGGQRLGLAALGEHGIADGLARLEVPVFKFARRDLGDPCAVAGMLGQAATLAHDGEGERPQAIRRRGRPGKPDPVPSTCSLQAGRGVGRAAAQSGQGVGQVGRDVQALAVQAARGGGSLRSSLRARAASSSAWRKAEVTSFQASRTSGNDGSTSFRQASTARLAATSFLPA